MAAGWGFSRRRCRGSPLPGASTGLLPSSLLLLLLPGLSWVAAGAAAASAEEAAGDVAVVAYLPEWRYDGANWETISEHVTHLLLFSLEPAPDGKIIATDRLPKKNLMDLARQAARRHGTKLLLCFGGNGRSDGFSAMSRNKKARSRFVKGLVRMLDQLDLDGVDYNWEYPGYRFGQGYLADTEVEADYKGLTLLIKDTVAAFAAGPPRATLREVTMAYYPDTRQERLLKQYGIDQSVSFMHMMSYDQGGQHHSTMDFGKKCADQGVEVLPPDKLTLGLPFYGRDTKKGDWTTYEDLVQRHDPLALELDAVKAPGGGKASIGFNGVTTIEAKTRYALEQGLGGVMIWEVGQDCRLVQVTHGTTTHVRTCPSDEKSLLLAITRAIQASGRGRRRAEGWQPEDRGGGGNGDPDRGDEL